MAFPAQLGSSRINHGVRAPARLGSCLVAIQTDLAGARFVEIDRGSLWNQTFRVYQSSASDPELSHVKPHESPPLALLLRGLPSSDDAASLSLLKVCRALSCFSVPLLQAIANDDIISFLRPMKKLSAKSEPIRALIFTTVLCICFSFIGSLDQVSDNCG